MLDLLGFWGNVTVFTWILAVMPLIIIGFHLSRHLWKVTTEPLYGDLSVFNDYVKKRVPWVSFIASEGGLAINAVGLVVLGFILGGAHDCFIKDNPNISFIETISAVSQVMAPVTSWVFILVAGYFGARWGLRKGYVLSQKIGKAIDKIENPSV